MSTYNWYSKYCKTISFTLNISHGTEDTEFYFIIQKYPFIGKETLFNIKSSFLLIKTVVVCL